MCAEVQRRRRTLVGYNVFPHQIDFVADENDWPILRTRVLEQRLVERTRVLEAVR